MDAPDDLNQSSFEGGGVGDKVIGVGFSESAGGGERRNTKKGPCQGSDGKLVSDPGPEPQAPVCMWKVRPRSYS